MTDTSIQAEVVRLRALGAMSPARRFSMATGWSASLRDMIRGSLQKQFPLATEDQLRRLLADRWLGADVAARVYGAAATHG